MIEDWRNDAACKGHPHPEWWFPEGRNGSETRRSRAVNALRICWGCPVLAACREDAERHAVHGIWGGVDHGDFLRRAVS